MLWERIKAVLTSKPNVSVPDILRRIEQRQPTIDKSVKVSNDQMRQVEAELQKRVDADPGVLFRQAELQWWQSRQTGENNVRH